MAKVRRPASLLSTLRRWLSFLEKGLSQRTDSIILQTKVILKYLTAYITLYEITLTPDTWHLALGSWQRRLRHEAGFLVLVSLIHQ